MYYLVQVTVVHFAITSYCWVIDFTPFNMHVIFLIDGAWQASCTKVQQNGTWSTYSIHLMLSNVASSVLCWLYWKPHVAFLGFLSGHKEEWTRGLGLLVVSWLYAFVRLHTSAFLVCLQPFVGPSNYST